MIIRILFSGSKIAFIAADNRRRFTAQFLELQLVFPLLSSINWKIIKN
jgi:hypothetical protein